MTAATLKKAFAELRAAALTYPEVHEDFPWGHSAFKVAKKKVFCFLVLEPKGLSLSCKLPLSSDMALMLPFAEPTGYGLGKSGWVSAAFEPSGKSPPVALLKEWLDESYRALAPKKLLKVLDARPPTSKSARS